MRVALHPGETPDGAVRVVDLDTRSRPERAARASVRRAFASRAAKRADILYKKIDSTLKGHVAAELAAARRALGRRPVLFAPAFPAQGRTTRGARLFLRGKPASTDLRAILSRAGLPASLADLRTVRTPGLGAALQAALAIGARGIVCDAATDADLDRIARAGLSMRPRPLFVGSAGLARALARRLRRQADAKRPRVERRPILVAVGSASPVSVRQARWIPASSGAVVAQLAWTRAPTRRDLPVVRRLGRMVARVSPKAHYVLTGGETARAVLGARGIREYRLLGEVEPGVPFGMARDGTLICTKAGGFGSAGTLARCVRRLQSEMKRT